MKTPYGRLIPPDLIPEGFDEVVALYGDPLSLNFTSRLTLIAFPYPLEFLGSPITHGTVHRLAAPNFYAALDQIQVRGLTEHFRRYAGCYFHRTKRGMSVRLSTHSFGIAIDGDAVQYPLGSLKRYPDEVVECFTDFGFVYGGDFSGRKDPMHFQLAKGY
jgi:hypothetical protein